MSVFKKRPELLDVLRRRGVTLESWCSEFAVDTWDDLLMECVHQDVTPPPVEYRSIVEKESLKEILDDAHDRAEMISIAPDDELNACDAQVIRMNLSEKPTKRAKPVRPTAKQLRDKAAATQPGDEVQVCTREAGHDGACNGWPSPTCKIYGEENET